MKEIVHVTWQICLISYFVFVQATSESEVGCYSKQHERDGHDVTEEVSIIHKSKKYVNIMRKLV